MSRSCRTAIAARPLVLALVALIGAAAAWWGWTAMARRRPESLLREAFAQAPTDSARALELCRQAVAAAGGNYPEAERLACLVAARRGDWPAALAAYQGLDLAQSPPEFLIEFAQLSQNCGGPADEGIAALEEVRRRRIPASFSALDALYSIHRADDRPREMLDCAREMALLQPRRPELWWKVLELLDTRGLSAEFLDTLRLALRQELPPDTLLEMRHRLIERLIDSGDVAAARGELTTLPPESQGLGRARFHEARVQRLEGNSTGALATLQQVAHGEVAEVELLKLQSLLLLDLRREEEAVPVLKRLVELDEYELTHHFKLAEAYRKLNRPEAAAEHDAAARDIRDKRARIHRLRETAKQRPDDLSLYEELAALHRALNDAYGANLWEKRARDLSAGRRRPR